MLTVRSDAIEHLAQCDTFAFDKTGTLTLGELRVEQIATFGNLDAAQAVALAAALEAHSEHPIGKALRAQGIRGAGAGRPITSTGWAKVFRGPSTTPSGVSANRHSHCRLHLPGFRPTIPTLMSSAYVVVALCDMDAGNGALFALSDQMRPGVQRCWRHCAIACQTYCPAQR